MKPTLKLLFLLTLIKTPTISTMTPEDSAQQRVEASRLLQANVQLSTEFMQLFKLGLEEKLKSLQGLSKSVTKLEPTSYSPEVARTIPDSDLTAYWNAIQDAKKVLEQIAEYTEHIKMSMFRDHIVTVREIERAKQRAKPISPQSCSDHLTPCPGGDEIV